VIAKGLGNEIGPITTGDGVMGARYESFVAGFLVDGSGNEYLLPFAAGDMLFWLD
jgi:hypothetical protein